MMKIDESVLKATQEAYLWLLDRTGVYVGTVIALMTLGVFMANGLGQKPGVILAFGMVLLPMLLLAALHWRMQRAGMNEGLNRASIRYEESLVRRLATVLTFVYLMIGTISLDFRGAANAACWIGIHYMLAVKIRDRDKKPFFEKKLQPAYEGV